MHLRKAVSVCPSVRPSIGDVDVFEEMQGSWFLINYYIITYLNKSARTRRRPLRVFFSHLSSTRRPFWLSRAVLICTPNTPFCYSQKKKKKPVSLNLFFRRITMICVLPFCTWFLFSSRVSSSDGLCLWTFALNEMSSLNLSLSHFCLIFFFLATCQKFVSF